MSESLVYFEFGLKHGGTKATETHEGIGLTNAFARLRALRGSVLQNKSEPIV
jgi:hypothetical protein